MSGDINRPPFTPALAATSRGTMPPCLCARHTRGTQRGCHTATPTLAAPTHRQPITRSLTARRRCRACRHEGGLGRRLRCGCWRGVARRRGRGIGLDAKPRAPPCTLNQPCVYHSHQQVVVPRHLFKRVVCAYNMSPIPHTHTSLDQHPLIRTPFVAHNTSCCHCCMGCHTRMAQLLCWVARSVAVRGLGVVQWGCVVVWV